MTDSISRSDQLIECVVKKAGVEASLHAAQMLLLDIVAILDDDSDTDVTYRALALERFEAAARHYLLTSAWVLPPDEKLLASLSLAGADERDDGAGEDPSSRSDGEVA